MSDKPISDDHRALLRIAEGGRAGEEAFKQFFKRYRPKLLSFLLKRRMNMADAEEVVQRVFIAVSKSASSFRGESAVSSWLFSISRNEMVSFLREAGQEKPVDEKEWERIGKVVAAKECNTSSDPKTALLECFQSAYQAFEKVHPAAADLIFRVLENEHWDSNDIATYLGRTAGAAREYLSQCRKKLRPFVEPCRHLLGEQP
jgi:RNA polymerase sigma-70 factor, ECF subfamily